MDVDKSPWRVIFSLIDEIRIQVNRRMDHLEQWQIVMYTLSICLFIQWIRKISKFEDFISYKKLWYEFLYNLPMYKKKFEEGRELAYKDLEERIHRADRLKEFYKYLPDRGLPIDDIIREATTYRTMSDILSQHGHLCGSIYAIEDDDANFQRLLRQMFELYSYSNATYPETFPSIRKMEAECVRILCSLYHGTERSCGAITTSGSESIILACLAHRNNAFKKGIRKPEMIVCNNVHFGYFKAAELLGIKVIRIMMNSKYAMNIGAVKRSIGRETCLIVASAPSFVTGVMDNIEEIAQLALRFDVPVHVDATIGGFILPFMDQCDYPAPGFDFRISGVSSISVDMHKYGNSPIGSSAVLYRDTELLHCQSLSNVNWAGGIYTSPTLGGSRSGLLIALTWASLLYQGRLSFVERTQRVLDAAQMLKARLEDFEELQILGDPMGPVMAIISKNAKLHIHALGDEMNELGWSFTYLQHPNALRICITAHQIKSDVLENLLTDLAKCSNKILTEHMPSEYPSKTNVIFGISGSFTDRGVIDDLPNIFLDAYYSTPVSTHGIGLGRKRTLSIEGRKLSQLQMSSGLATLREQYHREHPLEESTDLTTFDRTNGPLEEEKQLADMPTRILE